MPLVCLYSSDSFGVAGSCERYSRGGSLEFGRLSSSLMKDDDDEVRG
jgi:hypothetical protein